MEVWVIAREAVGKGGTEGMRGTGAVTGAGDGGGRKPGAFKTPTAPGTLV